MDEGGDVAVHAGVRGAQQRDMHVAFVAGDPNHNAEYIQDRRRICGVGYPAMFVRIALTSSPWR